MDVGHHERELIGAHSRNEQPRHQRRHPRRYLAQQRIAGLTTKRVIDGLEAFDIEDEQRAPAARMRGRGELLSEPLVEQRPVGELGEGVVVREVFSLLALVDMLERERDIAGDLEKQFHLLVIEMTGFRGVKREHADALAVLHQRYDGDGSYAARGRFAPQRFAAALHVLRHDRRKRLDRSSDQSEIGSRLERR